MNIEKERCRQTGRSRRGEKKCDVSSRNERMTGWLGDCDCDWLWVILGVKEWRSVRFVDCGDLQHPEPEPEPLLSLHIARRQSSSCSGYSSNSSASLHSRSFHHSPISSLARSLPVSFCQLTALVSSLTAVEEEINQEWKRNDQGQGQGQCSWESRVNVGIWKKQGGLSNWLPADCLDDKLLP